jgi:hypothetical protein
MTGKTVLALLVIGAVMVAVFGAAAGLSVQGGAIQAGDDYSLKCDNDGVQVLGWGLETDDGTVHFVRIGGIDPNCTGNDIWVWTTKGGANLVRGGPVTLDGTMVQGGSPGYAKINLDSPAKAKHITDIHVYIEGPNP